MKWYLTNLPMLVQKLTNSFNLLELTNSFNLLDLIIEN